MRSSRHSKPKGLTLVEVIASLALLSTVLVTVLLSWSRHTRQLTESNRQYEAFELLDQQIAEWYSSQDGLPTNSRGVFEMNSAYSWQTQISAARSSNPEWRVATVKVTAYKRTHPTRELAEIELLVDRFDAERAGNPQ